MKDIRLLSFLFFVAVAAGCSREGGPSGTVQATNQQTGALDADQKRRLMLLTSTFENSCVDGGTAAFAYDYIENLNDGRGFTAGRVGFCTGTHDLLHVVEVYEQNEPDNILTKYLPRLREISQETTVDGLNPDVNGLDGFEDAWRKAAQDPLFLKAQDQVVDETYYEPAMQVADQLGLRLPFGRAIIYDTAVMHGTSMTSPDSLIALVRRTEESLCPHVKIASSCTPLRGFGEKTWLRAFLAVRKQDLLNPSDPATQAEWSQNAVRADILLQMLNDGKTDQLNQPIQLDNFYGHCAIP